MQYPVIPPQHVVDLWRKQGKTEDEIKAIKRRLANHSKGDINHLSDDLTVIRNIGRYKAEMLTEMGITTYQQLIEADSEEIASTIGSSLEAIAKYKAIAAKLDANIAV